MSFSPVLSSRSIRIAPTLQLRGDVSPSVPTFGFSSSLTVCSAPAVTAGGCESIFGSLDIVSGLPYISGGVALHPSLVLLYIPAEASMQYNPSITPILLSYTSDG